MSLLTTAKLYAKKVLCQHQNADQPFINKKYLILFLF